MDKKGGEFAGLIRLFKNEFGQYKIQILVLAALSFVSGILEGVGITAIIPLFSFVSEGRPKGSDFISRAIEKFFSILSLDYTLFSLLAFVVALFIVKSVALFLANYTAGQITSRYETKTRNELLASTLDADWPYLARQKLGHLDQILTTNVDQSSKLLSYISYSILVVANLITYSLLVVNISATVAALALILGAALLLALGPLFRKNTFAAEKQVNLYKTLAHYINENVLGMKIVKSAFVKDKVKEKAGEYFENMRRMNMEITFLRNATNVLLQPLGLLFIISVFVFFYKATVFNFAAFAVAVYAINKVFTYVQMAQSNLHAIYGLAPHLVSVAEYRSEVARSREADSGTEGFSFKNSLEFKNVGFSYSRERGIVLKNLNFRIKKGEMTGIIGPTGAGKTTVVDLLLRLYSPTEGEILLDGKNIAEISMREWRNNIGYVSQETFLLNDTIENNIRFYGEEISRQDIKEAAKLANTLDFINSLPQKFATVIGERGIMLSGGQRQRIILARALARRPQILVLDEATSALDSESESLIQKSIEGLKGTITVLAIAHRLSTVKISDRIIVLDKGKIIEEDSPEELLKNKDSYFFKVYNLRN